ncbi:glucokinase [Helicobacter pylori]|nr:glucokinase [Helicobacter pylori]
MPKTETYPRLLADIGGTNARFGLEVAPRQIECIEVLRCEDFESLSDAVRFYLSKCKESLKLHPIYGSFAVATPIMGDFVQMTNNHWTFSIETTRQCLTLKKLLVINDFVAQAYAISAMQENDRTGLGVSTLIQNSDGSLKVLPGEGGHVSFAPFDDLEILVWQYARSKFNHVSAERFLSGSGLVLIYEALSKRKGLEKVAKLSKAELTPQIISERALNGDYPICRLTLDTFCSMLGTLAADVALTLGARGGVYLCGGIIPRFIDYFKTSPFRARFETKGRMGAFLASIPVHVVLKKTPGLDGAGIALENYLLHDKI